MFFVNYELRITTCESLNEYLRTHERPNGSGGTQPKAESPAKLLRLQLHPYSPSQAATVSELGNDPILQPQEPKEKQPVQTAGIRHTGQ
jgi:hypothetical protein